jgi:acyl carrier protein
MTRQEHFEKLAAVVRDTFPQPGLALDLDSTATDVDGWDSVSHAFLILNLETAFGVQLPLERTYQVKNLGELVDLVMEVSSGAKAAA